MGDLEPAGPPPPPVPRAGDADRERTAELLRQAGGRGQLDVEELDERLAAAFAARTRADLAVLTADLPDDDERPTAVSVEPQATGAVDWVVSVMSGADRRGRWRVGSRVRVVSVMGGGDVDLSEAELTAPVTEITVVSIMGGADVRVPEGARVEVSKLGIMGGNDVQLGSAPVPADAPLIRIKLFALMGGNGVARGPRPRRRKHRLH